MKRNEFLTALKRKISSLPKNDVKEHISFYGEMIDDRIDSGLSEAEAVADIGDVNSVAEQILRDSGSVRTASEARIYPQKRKRGAVEITLMILGFPLLVSLIACAAAIALALYVVLCSVAVSCWAILFSLVICSVAGAIVGPALILIGKGAYGAVVVGASLFLAGVSILMFFVCKALTVCVLKLPKKIICLISEKKGKRRAA